MRMTEEKIEVPVTGMQPQQLNPEAPQVMTKYRWLMLALGFLIIIINYMDRSAMSYAIGPIRSEFHLTNSEFGMIMAAFPVGYAVMTTGGGIIVDLWGARKVWAWSAVAWSTATALLGIASGMWMLFAFRLFLGLTEGPCFPALTRVVTDWLPMSERAKSTAIGLAAVPLAAVVGGPLISHLILSVGWKPMFFVLGSLGIVWAVIWYYCFRDYPDNSRHVNSAELEFIKDGQPSHTGESDEEIRKHHLSAGKTTWSFILFSPSLLSNNYAFFAFGYLLFFAVNWLPGYLEQTYAVELKHVGWFVTCIWLPAAILLPACGVLSDWLLKKTGSIRIARSHLMWPCQLLCAICFLLVTQVHSLPIATALISAGLGIGLAPNACFYALNSDLAKDRAATSLGLMDSFFAVAGIMALALTGVLSDTSGNFNLPIMLLVGFTLSSVVGILLFQHPDRDLKVRGGTFVNG
jgi:MFS family permease